MLKRIISAALISAAAISLAACGRGTSADDRNTLRQEKALQQASVTVGIANITNFTEKGLANKILELRDQPNLATFTYVQGIDGTLKCLGHSIGFGLPYSAQTTSPQKLVAEYAHYPDGTTSSAATIQTMPQPEPNGLFMPDSADGTWVILVNEADGKPFVLYVEPKITVSPVALFGPAIAQPCK